MTDPRLTDTEIDYAINGADVIYHGTTISRARMMNGTIEPRVGSFLRNVYPRARMKPLVFAADSQCKSKIWSSIRFAIAQELGIEKWEVTIRQFVENASLLEIGADRSKFRQASTFHKPQRGVEKFDFYSDQTVKADRVIVGRELVDFFGVGFLQANLIYEDWDVDGPAIARAEAAMAMTDGEYKVSQALLREFPDLNVKASGLGRIDISNPHVLTEEGIALLVRLSEEHGVLMAVDTGPLPRRMMKCAERNGFQNAIVSLQYEPAAYREERARARIERQSKEPDYLHGQCHILALALHRVSGLPIEGAVTFDHDINQWALVHAWVTWDGVEEMILHAGGVENVDAVLAEFPYGDEATVTRLTPERLLRMGEGRKYDKEEVEAKIEAAMPLARQLFEAAENGLSVDVTP